MRYIKFTGGNGYCGCDYEEYVMFPDDTTDDEIDNYSYELNRDNAETYEYVATGWGEYFEDECEEEEYYEDAACYALWEEVSEDEWNEACRQL